MYNALIEPREARAGRGGALVTPQPRWSAAQSGAGVTARPAAALVHRSWWRWAASSLAAGASGEAPWPSRPLDLPHVAADRHL